MQRENGILGKRDRAMASKVGNNLIEIAEQAFANVARDAQMATDAAAAAQGDENAREIVEDEKAPMPEFGSGDTITVHYRIREGQKERIQQFRGVVIQIRGERGNKMFTVRKISGGVGVERIFPMNSPYVAKVEVNKYGKVRRARIFYLRNLTGKRANIKEDFMRKARMVAKQQEAGKN